MFECNAKKKHLNYLLIFQYNLFYLTFQKCPPSENNTIEQKENPNEIMCMSLVTPITQS